MRGDMVGSTEVVVGPADLDEVFFDGKVHVVTGTAGDFRVTFIANNSALLHAVKDSGEPRTAIVQNSSIRRRQRIQRSA